MGPEGNAKEIGFQSRDFEYPRLRLVLSKIGPIRVFALRFLPAVDANIALFAFAVAPRRWFWTRWFSLFFHHDAAFSAF